MAGALAAMKDPHDAQTLDLFADPAPVEAAPEPPAPPGMCGDRWLATGWPWIIEPKEPGPAGKEPAP